MKHLARESVSSRKPSRQQARQAPKKTKLPRAHTYRRRPCPRRVPDVGATEKYDPAPEQDQMPAVRDASTATPVISTSQQDVPASQSASTREGLPPPSVPQTQCQPESRLPQDPPSQEWPLVALTRPNTLVKRRKVRPPVNADLIHARPRHYTLEVIANKLAKQKLFKFLACINCKSLTLNPIPFARCGVG